MAEGVFVAGDGHPAYMLRLLERAHPRLEDAKRIVGLGEISRLGVSLDADPRGKDARFGESAVNSEYFPD